MEVCTTGAQTPTLEGTPFQVFVLLNERTQTRTVVELLEPLSHQYVTSGPSVGSVLQPLQPMQKPNMELQLSCAGIDLSTLFA